MDEESVSEGALIESHHGTSVALPANPFAPIHGLYCSWNVSEPGGVDRMAKALRRADKASDDVLDEELPVEHFLCHVVELTDPQTGECVNAMRTVLIGPDGATLALVSRGAFESLPVLGRAFGVPPWNPPRKVRVRRQKTRRGFHTIILEPVEG